MNLPHIFILTGAGVSAESGLGTFRDKDGLWTRYDLADVASIDGYRRNPKLVLDFCNARRRNALEAKPNAAHTAIAELQRAWRARGGRLFLCTQNVDDLHEQGGAENVRHMHGELFKARCGICEAVRACRVDLSAASACEACGAAGAMRPHIVWFGEYPHGMREIERELDETELFVAIGTSGAVYPAAGFVMQARAAGAETLELNLERSDVADAFDQGRYGLASDIVPAWVRSMIGETK
jgi:NAD-dependent deacetylase